MTKVTPKERFSDFEAHGKFGIAFEYGQRIYGQVRYGAEEPKIYRGFGDPESRFGIYQTRHEQGKRFTIKENYYIPANPRTVPQEAWRAVFTQGMTNWSNLTQEQKDEYNERAKKIHLHGVNLYLRLWLKSQ